MWRFLEGETGEPLLKGGKLGCPSLLGCGAFAVFGPKKHKIRFDRKPAVDSFRALFPALRRLDHPCRRDGYRCGAGVLFPVTAH
jgi:hypothetical protein